MKNFKTLALCIILPALFIISCDGVSSSDNRKSFDSKLIGMWKSNDPSVYSGKLIIEYYTITIEGYDESQTPSTPAPPDYTKHPFRNITKKVALEGYSEDGKIYIKDGSSFQSFSYDYDEQGTYSNKKKILKFVFGGRTETLDCPMY
jgi:hypothetical protein